MMFHLILNLWSKTNPSEQRQPRTMQNYFLPWLAPMAAMLTRACAKNPLPNFYTRRIAQILQESFLGEWTGRVFHIALTELWGIHFLIMVVWAGVASWLLFLFSRWICRNFLKDFGKKPQAIYLLEAVFVFLSWI